MGQETRKDPRAKVLTMTVRYKSATLDEFIEHHSHDVSRGGMFIKTPSPFPPGTLLKFEVKIAEDQKVIQGVGRVVWKRESESGDKERPNGMGVKFIKIDDQSRKTIDTLVDSRGDAAAAYEAGGGDGGGSSKTAPGATPAAAMTPATPESASGKPPMVRKATMIGLGAMGSHAAAAAAKAAESASPPRATGGGMFPQSDSEADMPAPEDRTVMKQAAELLQDALREVGGSMDDVGTKPDSKKPASLKPEPERKPQEPELAPELKADAPAAGDKGPHTLRSEPPKSEKNPEQKSASARPAAVPAAAARSPSERAPTSSARPSARPQPILSEAPPAGESGGGRVMIILAGIALLAGAVFFLSKKDPTPPTPEPESPAATAPAPEAPPAPAVEAPKPVEATAAPAESASAAPAPSAALAPSAAVKPMPATPLVAATPVSKPVPAVPAPRPVPAAPKPKPAPVAAPADAAPAAPATPKPAEPAPAPAPKPKPADTSGDNPY
jgi:uncharacterized protein (TIGR02266 family)